MATILQLSPLDHGKLFSDEELEHAEYEPGFKYEVIQGALYVTPAANLPHDWFEKSLLRQLLEYSVTHPTEIGWITDKARVYVPGMRKSTVPEPDLVLYRVKPTGRTTAHWRDISPFIVVEILSPDTEDKDLVRNVDLYLQVPSILEYWVFDLEPTAAAGLIVFRRENDAWQRLPITAKEYQPDLLPGLSVPTRSEHLEQP